jgi:hypothetical protein
MRHCLAAALALAAASLTGCFTAPPDRALTRYDAQLPFHSLAGDDVVQFDIYVVERPIADPCINREIWELADEQVVQERKQILEENGFRACVLGDSPPDNLRALLHSERSCANPRRLLFHASKPTQVVLGPVLPRLAVPLYQQNGKTAIDLDLAQCMLQVAARLTEDGKIVLQFAPQIRHGQPEALPHPVQDPSGELRWDVQVEQPTETYPGLGWKLTVTPDTYVAIGTRLDRPDTLGQRAFLNTEGIRMQRLLVMRVSRALADAPMEEPPDGSAPLALQAGWGVGSSRSRVERAMTMPAETTKP